MNNDKLFCEHFMSIMVKLAEDKVVNVKLVLAEIVKKHHSTNGKLIENE